MACRKSALAREAPFGSAQDKLQTRREEDPRSNLKLYRAGERQLVIFDHIGGSLEQGGNPAEKVG